MNPLWSYVLTAVGITGFVLAGRKIWWCWYVNIGCQGLWFTYAIVTKQWGFVGASVIYTIVFTQNAVAWTREHRAEVAAIETPMASSTTYPWSERWGPAIQSTEKMTLTWEGDDS